MTIACMGGFCAVRENCKYYCAQDKSYPVERLCEKDSPSLFKPRPHDAFERRVIELKEAA